MDSVNVRIINKDGAVVSTQAPVVFLTQEEPASGFSYVLAKIDEQFSGCFLEVVIDEDDKIIKRCRKMSIDHLEGNNESIQ